MSTTPDLRLAFTPLTLPNGQVLKNRIAKAAMEENMAAAAHFLSPTPELVQLYRTWAEGGSGLIITGNVMIDHQAVGGVAPVSTSREVMRWIKDDEAALNAFQAWSKAGKSNGAQFWFQLNHPGRQAFAPAATKILGPSSTEAVDIGRLGKAFFSKPREMTEGEIEDVIARFAEGARFAESVQATGVQVHGAHGYLVNQFLSPLNNVRTDKWGGSLPNRARFLFDVLRAIRADVSPSFAVSVKLNSADFQRGGFSDEDARWVIEKLNEFHVPGRGGVDLIEISGGNYESTAMSGNAARGERTMAREAYFLDFAHQVTAISRVPIMVTGGIRRAEIIEKVVAPGPGQTTDSVQTIAGLGTAMALEPDLPNRLARGEDPCPALQRSGPSFLLPASLAFVATLRQVQYCMRAISRGRSPSAGVSPLWALLSDQLYSFTRLRALKKLMKRVQEEPLSSLLSSSKDR